MRYSDLPEWASKAGEWAGRYFETLSGRRVRPNVLPGEIYNQLPDAAPENPEPMTEVFADFERLVPDAMTHWQHPRFFAYFPANAAPASILAEQLISSLACNCMLWQTSPAATEIEQRMMEWFRKAVGLPDQFTGVIQDSATTATLCSVLTMRELALKWQGLETGMSSQPVLRIYASAENHSSIDKAVRISGIGQANLVKIPTDSKLAMSANLLRQAILQDIESGFTPAGVVLCIGGTANGACDRLNEIVEVAREFDLYSHVDAAWAGAATMCPEYRFLWDGIEGVDSIVINPNKWTGAQIDCSVQFLARPSQQAAAVGMRPAYLKTVGLTDITDLSELSIPLGRRFRALKLWFVFRAYGLSGLRKLVRDHIRWIRMVEKRFESDPGFDVVTSSLLALFTFRLNDTNGNSDELTMELLRRVNEDGRIYLTPSEFEDRPTIRMTAGTFSCTEEDVLSAYDVVREIADSLLSIRVKPTQSSG